jgi:hypothetical protein
VLRARIKEFGSGFRGYGISYSAGLRIKISGFRILGYRVWSS